MSKDTRKKQDDVPIFKPSNEVSEEQQADSLVNKTRGVNFAPGQAPNPAVADQYSPTENVNTPPAWGAEAGNTIMPRPAMAGDMGATLFSTPSKEMVQEQLMRQGVNNALDPQRAARRNNIFSGPGGFTPTGESSPSLGLVSSGNPDRPTPLGFYIPQKQTIVNDKGKVVGQNDVMTYTPFTASGTMPSGHTVTQQGEQPPDYTNRWQFDTQTVENPDGSKTEVTFRQNPATGQREEVSRTQVGQPAPGKTQTREEYDSQTGRRTEVTETWQNGAWVPTNRIEKPMVIQKGGMSYEVVKDPSSGQYTERPLQGTEATVPPNTVEVVRRVGNELVTYYAKMDQFGNLLGGQYAMTEKSRATADDYELKTVGPLPDGSVALMYIPKQPNSGKLPIMLTSLQSEDQKLAREHQAEFKAWMKKETIKNALKAIKDAKDENERTAYTNMLVGLFVDKVYKDKTQEERDQKRQKLTEAVKAGASLRDILAVHGVEYNPFEGL